MSKLNRDIQTIVQILLRNKVSAIYPTEIANLLQCPAEPVENVLFSMMEEEILEHKYEMHCADCGGVMFSFEPGEHLSCAPFPCDHCLTQMESMDMNETVSAFYPMK
jgi:hypothetical protein